MDQMRVIAIESKIEWRGFTDEMKMVTVAYSHLELPLQRDALWSLPLTYANIFFFFIQNNPIDNSSGLSADLSSPR